MDCDVISATFMVCENLERKSNFNAIILLGGECIINGERNMLMTILNEDSNLLLGFEIPENQVEMAHRSLENFLLSGKDLSDKDGWQDETSNEQLLLPL